MKSLCLASSSNSRRERRPKSFDCGCSISSKSQLPSTRSIWLVLRLQNSLQILMERMCASHPVFMRCLKPNQQKQAHAFDETFVRAQVRVSSQRQRNVNIDSGWFSFVTVVCWRPLVSAKKATQFAYHSRTSFISENPHLLSVHLMKRGSVHPDTVSWRKVARLIPSQCFAVTYCKQQS